MGSTGHLFLFLPLSHSGSRVPRTFSNTPRVIITASLFPHMCKNNKTPAVSLWHQTCLHAAKYQARKLPSSCDVTEFTDIHTPPLKPMARLGLSGKESFLSVLYMEQDQGIIEGRIFRPLGAQQIALLVSVSQLPAVSQAEQPSHCLWEHLSSVKMWPQTAWDPNVVGSRETSSHLALSCRSSRVWAKPDPG